MKFEMNNGRFRNASAGATAFLLVICVTGSIAAMHLHAQAAAATPAKPANSNPTNYHPDRFPKRAEAYYQGVWGIDLLSVKAVESGELIRFSYRVLDPNKAAILNDKKIDAFLISPAEGVKLVIPSLEKVGQLRQINTPVAGTSYWMAFSNPRMTVKRGDRVNVVIGQFHADGLVVE